MLSIIIKEHNEGREFVTRMLEQVSTLQVDKEVQFVTSALYDKFLSEYHIDLKGYDFPIYVTGDIQSTGGACNVGAKLSNGSELLFLDSHVCFNNEKVNRLLSTLRLHPNAVIGAATQPIEYPSCTVASSGIGYGVAHRFVDRPFEWIWVLPETIEHESVVPSTLGASFLMTRSTYQELARFGGFITVPSGASFEEEASIRLARLGHPTYVEPRSVFGHYFKGQPSHRSQDEHMQKGNHLSYIIGFYLNVFNPELYNYIDAMLRKTWGTEYEKNMQTAIEQYSWLRRKLEPFANRIDENWYLRRV